MTYEIFEENGRSFIMHNKTKYRLDNNDNGYELDYNQKYALMISLKEKRGLFDLQTKKILLNPSRKYNNNISSILFTTAFKKMIEIYEQKLNKEKLKQLKEDLNNDN